MVKNNFKIATFQVQIQPNPKDGLFLLIQGVTGGMCETLGECSLGQTIPI